jgi:polysaccharide pyruvyl transferase WcaK-like protein
MKSLLIGYYGYTNAGDDAFVLVAQWANQHFGLGALFDYTADQVFLSPLGRVRPIYTSIVPERFMYRYRAWKFRSVASRYHLNLFCGGSNFHSATSMQMWSETFKSYSGKVAGVGVSVGPFKDIAAEKACNECLKRFDLLAVRDMASYERVMSMPLDINLHHTFDVGFLINEVMPPVCLEGEGDRERVIGISLCNYERYVGRGDSERHEKRRWDFIVQVIEGILDQDLADNVLLLGLNSHPTVGDSQICKSIVSHLSRYGDRLCYYCYDGDVYRLIRVINGLQLLIGMRLHSIIFACALGIPFLMVPYHEKCYEFGRMIGLDESRLISHDSTSIASVIDLLKIPISSFNTNLFRMKAARNFELLKELLA